MPKVTGSSLPLSGLFAIDKPSGVVTMKLLNQINELMATSDLFLPVDKHNDNDDNNNSPRKRRKGHHHRSRAGKVKLGQGGTLDPLASGVLVLGVNDGTKKLGNFLHGTKEYRATGLLGSATDSYDSDGKVVRRASYAHVTREKVEAALERFRGEIKQLPPIYSAIKMDGKPLYEYARENRPLPRAIEARSCTVYNMELLNFRKAGEHSWKGSTVALSESEREAMIELERLVHDSVEPSAKQEAEQEIVAAERENEDNKGKTNGDESSKEDQEGDNGSLAEDGPPVFEIKMTVSSGTYVRTIIHDLGRALGSAAHLVELVRTRQGQWALDPDTANRIDGEDGNVKELHKVVPWSVLQEGIDGLAQAKNPSQGMSSAPSSAAASNGSSVIDKAEVGENGGVTGTDAAATTVAADGPEQDARAPWERAIVDALQA